MSEVEKLKQIAALVEEYDSAMKSIGGCSNGTCLVDPPKGMHTNGPCKCDERKYVARRVMMRAHCVMQAIKKIVDI